MLRRFFIKLSTIHRDEYDTAHFFRKNLSGQIVTDLRNAGIDSHHPVVVDILDPNSDGTVDLKAQGDTWTWTS